MNKNEFMDGINSSTEFDEHFFKRVYGYSVCDPSFIALIADMLIKIKRQDVIKAYNEWFTKWKADDDSLRKKIAEGYRTESDRRFNEWVKEERERREAEWLQKRRELLQKKKVLLLMKKYEQSTQS